LFNIFGENDYSSLETNQSLIEIGISAQPAGIYVIEIRSVREKIYKKIIKE
jgi:hypothetical protein